VLWQSSGGQRLPEKRPAAFRKIDDLCFMDAYENFKEQGLHHLLLPRPVIALPHLSHAIRFAPRLFMGMPPCSTLWHGEQRVTPLQTSKAK
jgi:hypothetical protein